jgi:dienelactone hydrolase
MRILTLLAVLLGVISVTSLRAQAPSAARSSLDTALQALWNATGEGEREAAGSKIVASGATFDDVAHRLKGGRSYAGRKSGRIELPSRAGGVALDNVVEIPADYDPARAWPLRVSLHGGAGREPPGPDDPPARPLNNRIASDGEIVLHPRAWFDSAWWTPSQLENLTKLIDRVKHDYNVDESRVYLTGISDGGTGVYNLAMRYATPWAACIPLNGHPSVIANPDTGADGQLYSGNLVNCPLRIVNGGRDRLYPAASVAPIIEMFKRTGATLQFHVRRGNDFDVRTRGVQTFTLLISPDVVDVGKPVRVTVNGKSVHDAIVKKDVATLVKWAARDQDRTMLYGAELHIIVP